MTTPALPLTAAFRAALGSRAGDAQGDLEPRLQAIVDEARAAFPEIANAADLFARALAERIDPDEPVESALAALRGKDLWLACGCARGDPASLRIFDQRYLSKVPALIRRADADGQLAQEVAQELREKLLVPEAGRARIADYSGRGDLLGWLRIVALRTGLRLKRRNQQAAGVPLQGGTLPDELLGGPDPERDHLRVRYRGEYQQAFRDALAALPAAERLILKLHYTDGLTLPRLAALYRVHRATVARRLAEARRSALDGTRALLQQRLRLSESEFESILALVRSQMAVSLRGGEPGPGGEL